MFNRDFDLAIEMKKIRQEFIEEQIMNSGDDEAYDHLLEKINIDIFDNMDKFEEWRSIKGITFLNYNLLLSNIILKRSNLKEMIMIGKNCIKLSVDNYKKVQTGVDIVNDVRCVENINNLVEQLYNTEVYSANCLNYLDDLKLRIATKYYDGDFNKVYIEKMKESRKKVKCLDNKYKRKN